MAQTGYTPISIYYSSTAGNTPTAGNLVAGELAINTADGKLFYKDSAGVVQVIAGKGGAGVAGGSNTQVQYNSSGSLAGSANFTFNGTTVTIANDASISGLTVGKGGGAVSGNVLVNTSALASNTTGSNLVAVGDRALNANTTGNGNSAYGYLALYANTTGGNNTGLGGTALIGNTTGSYNTAVGYDSLRSNTTASSNTAVGYQAAYANTTGVGITALGNQAGYNSTGDYNTALGNVALNKTTNGTQNTAVGGSALYYNTTGNSNVSVGYQSMLGANGTSTGNYNTALGTYALYSYTTASNNTAVGYQTLYSNTTGTQNTAVGMYALYPNTTGSLNSAFGWNSLGANTTGGSNVAIGFSALQANTTASNNTAVGYQAGYSNTTGAANICLGGGSGYTNTASAGNTFVGYQAGYTYNTTGNTFNTFVGYTSGYAMTTGSKNTILGSYTGNQGGLDIRTASNYIVLSDGDGNPRQVIDNNGKVIIGDTAMPVSATNTQFYVNQASGDYTCYFKSSNATAGNNYGLIVKYSAASPNGVGNEFLYCADSTAQRFSARSNGGLANYSANNTNLSDAREKKNIELAGNYLDKICAIPVKTFLYNDQIDDDLNLGIIAQDVQAIAPELVSEDDWGTKEEPKVRLSIYQTDLQYALMKCIQELKQEIDSLKQQLGK